MLPGFPGVTVSVGGKRRTVWSAASCQSKVLSVFSVTILNAGWAPVSLVNPLALLSPASDRVTMAKVLARRKSRRVNQQTKRVPFQAVGLVISLPSSAALRTWWLDRTSPLRGPTCRAARRFKRRKPGSGDATHTGLVVLLHPADVRSYGGARVIFKTFNS